MLSRRVFAIRAVIIFVLVIVICATGSSTVVIYNFKCKSNDANSTMTHESHLKESRLEESGYMLGYEAGSLNYLKGGKIEFNDKIVYNDGQDEFNSRPSVYYNMTVFFEGERSISEIYANGFYPNNRAVSAKKAIRFEDLSYSMADCPICSFKNLGESYLSKQIHVNAEAIMGRSIRGNIGYQFAYNATVENGIIQTWDTTGWTNRTGARRIDWEERALMRGNLTVENNLVASDLFNPIDGRDWLPC
ncbi:Uncharacterised protein [uncultured archaeon]|nr:Uncharacterised protein [uncultured archaeon]